MSEQKIIGIDLGTTNSVVAIVEGGDPIVIPNQEGSNKTPSVIAFLDNNECIVGEIARRQAATNPARTISSIKRLMGVAFDDLEEWADVFPFDIVNHEDKVLIDINGYGYSPEQISALVLKKLKESAENFLGQEVNQAVITVPAHFDDSQRNATLEAARLAGIDVLRLINEPTAAALAYGMGKASDNEEVIAVYDFGGGTFDITILELAGKTFEVLTSTGDNRLGGDDLDNMLVTLVVNEFMDQHGVDLMRDPVTLRRLKEVAEKAKCELSTTKQTIIALPFIAYKDGTPLHLERQVTRGEFEEMIESYVDRTIKCCKRALEDARLGKKDIDKVILVGGSTRIPLVQEAVEDFFNLAPFKGINPDEVVALGAATQAGVFSGNVEEVVLLDVAPHSLGIEVKDGRFSRIIDKNATIPIKAAKNFTTTEDNQSYVNIHILQGDNDEAAMNRSLGKFTLADIPAQPKGRPRIRVTLFVNADGVMEISAEDLSSGLSKSLTIVHSELNDDERQKRRKARQKRTRGKVASGLNRGSNDGTGSRRYSSDSTGAPTHLSPRAGQAEAPSSRKKAQAAARTEENKQIEAETFAVLGDTSPGNAPTAHLGAHASSETVQLSGSRAPTNPNMTPPPEFVSSGKPGGYGSPQRYSRSEEFVATKTTPSPSAWGDDTELLDMDLLPPAPSGAHFLPENGSLDDSKLALEPAVEIKAKPIAASVEDAPIPEIVEKAYALAEEGKDASEKAQDLYKEALAVLEDDAWNADARYDVLIRKASIQVMMGEEREASKTISLLVDHHGQEHAEELLRLCDAAVGHFSVVPSLRRDRGWLRETTGDLQGACEDLEFASKTEPCESDGPFLERLYRARIDQSNDPAAQFKLVKIYLKNNRVDEAIEILQDLQHHDPYETRAVKILGLCHWQKNLHFLAWQKFKQLPQTEEIRDILYRLGNDMETTGQLANALNVYEHIGAEVVDYRDAQSRIKKLRYRIKMHQDEAEASKVSGVLDDPRFTIIEEINRGSMGIIYKAKDKILEEVVALKVLNDYLGTDPAAVERFKREARAAKKLSHPYIVRIHDMYETGSKRFISMEYIDGLDLKRLLSDNKSFKEDQLIYYFLQICDALSYAHKLNIIHRDIKPANVMITESNHVKVTDFGIAKILKSEDSTKSGTAVIGTPLYMAPEQITGEGVDQRSDIYALGIMMYELVSGHPPFYLGNIEYHHIHSAPPPLPESVSPRLRDVIMKCVEKNAANRFQTVDEIFDILQVDER